MHGNLLLRKMGGLLHTEFMPVYARYESGNLELFESEESEVPKTVLNVAKISDWQGKGYTKTYKHAFGFVGAAKQTVFQACAPSKEEKEAWVHLFSNVQSTTDSGEGHHTVHGDCPLHAEGTHDGEGCPMLKGFEHAHDDTAGKAAPFIDVRPYVDDVDTAGISARIVPGSRELHGEIAAVLEEQREEARALGGTGAAPTMPSTPGDALQVPGPSQGLTPAEKTSACRDDRACTDDGRLILPSETITCTLRPVTEGETRGMVLKEFADDNGVHIVVQRLAPGGIAATVGLAVGDILTRVDGKSAHNFTIDELVQVTMQSARLHLLRRCDRHLSLQPAP
jgi:hypothetical protein